MSVEGAKCDDGDAAVAVAAADSDGDCDDPMLALDDVCAIVCPSAKSQRAIPKRRNHSGTIHELELPARARCAYPNDSVSNTVNIRMVRKGKKTLYMDKIHIEWLCTYLADEVGCSGVPLLPHAVAGVNAGPSANAKGNSSVPGLYISWNFQSGGGWVGTFVDGSLKGRKVATKPSELTREKFDKVAHWRGRTCSFSDASGQNIKDAAWDYIEWHCSGLVAGLAVAGPASVP